ncbi:hypothetical protein HanRHA438_Chr12g0551431 [Helianthus annuus]|nr:hypothetical protein HanRHA438_Chr12g0551431 [Helianthus annuus]
MMACLKYLRTVYAEIVVFYDFVHFVGKIDFVAEPNPYIYIYILAIYPRDAAGVTIYNRILVYR